MRKAMLGVSLVSAAAATIAGATSFSCSGPSGTPDGGDAAKFDGSTCTPSSTAGTLASFTKPVDPGTGGIIFAASGEVLALTGYPFPPVNSGDPVFVDGWDVKFTRLLVTVDKIKMWSNPDMNPGDESQTGPQIAEVDGPWAIDLSHADQSYLPGKGGPGEEAVPIAALNNQNLNGGAKFAMDGTRYAFGFDLIPATATSCDGRKTMNVNIDAPGQADYANMITNGCAVYYSGVATFKGTQHDPTCNSAADGGVSPIYSTWPQQVTFNLCFKSPTSYVNCQNPDNDPATPFPNEEHQRGVAFPTSGSIIGQVTIHTDHPFWDSVLHDSPAHFDQFAARLAGQADAGNPVVMLDMTKGVDFTAYTDALGHVLPWRYCIAPDTTVHPQFTGTMSFDHQSVPIGTDPTKGLRDYYDFSTYNQSTQGHLNSNGLCFVARNYPAPP
jgi:hypothetical protein